MATRNSVICPVGYSNKPRKHIEPSTNKKHHMHVDGDLLYRVKTCGGSSLLRTMLHQESRPDHRFYDYETAVERYQRFCTLVSNAVGGHGHEDPVQAAMDFMNTFTLPGV